MSKYIIQQKVLQTSADKLIFFFSVHSGLLHRSVRAGPPTEGRRWYVVTFISFELLKS